jgi:hypothetical protein
MRYVFRQMNEGFAYTTFKRRGLKKLRSERLKFLRLDALCG